MIFIAILYLILIFFLGSAFCTLFFPKLEELSKKTFRGNTLSLSSLWVLLPAWFFSGTLLLTWAVYGLACFFSGEESPLIKANAIAMAAAFLLSLIFYIILYFKNKENEFHIKTYIGNYTFGEFILLAAVLFLGYQMMWTTLYSAHEQLYVGYSVHSDFASHLGMIRSFSYGNNFPAQYSFFAGEDMKYHFMFQFLVGNLEFLGMKIDWAFNLVSLFGFFGMVALLYVLAVKISGRRAAGYLSCLFLLFRSSKSFYTYLLERPQGVSLWDYLFSNKEFIGYTTNESWGLWNLNVYCNQRHFAFTIILFLLILLLFLPHLYDFSDRLSNLKIEGGLRKKAGSFFILNFFTWEAWKVKNWKIAIGSGLLMGACAFWNGAVLIGLLIILFMLALFSDQKLEFLIAAGIASLLSFLQNFIFVDGFAVSPAFQFGFIAEKTTILGALDYILRLFGILPLLLLLAFLTVKGVRKYMMFAFFVPFIFAFLVSLTVDITVNHKYIILSVMLLNIFVAIFLVNLFRNRNIFVRFVCVLCVLFMTATGFYDFTTLMRRNSSQDAVVYHEADPVTDWIKKNATAKDIFLTAAYSLSPVVLGGAMLFEGWPYYAWTAGYDTTFRDEQVKEMYEADNPETLDALVKSNNIRYIVVDRENRVSPNYFLNEQNIANTYQAVLESGSAEWKTTIYDTTLMLIE